MQNSKADSGLFDPEVLKKVAERIKNSKPVYPTKESISKFFQELREDMINNKEQWDKLIGKDGE